MTETVNIENIPLGSSGAEYTITVPASADWFTLQLRGAVDLRISSVAGGTAHTYFTLKSGTRYDYVRPRRPPSQTSRNSLTLYVRPSASSQILELLYGAVV